MEIVTRVLSWLVGVFLLSILILILGDIVITSLGEMSLSFLLDSPLSGGRKGGIFPIIISTCLILSICLIFVFPIGMLTAIYLSKGKETSLVKKAVEVLAAVPSIVFGLFGNALFSIYFGMGFSILSGGLTLALMSLPLFITTVEKGIRSVPRRYHLVGTSLGMGQLTMIKYIVLPYALPSIIVGLVLSVGRSLAETAALIFTSGYVDRMPESLFDSGRSLSIHIYDLSMNVPGGDTNAYKSSLVLVILILTTNTIISSGLSAWHKKRIAI